LKNGKDRAACIILDLMRQACEAPDRGADAPSPWTVHDGGEAFTPTRIRIGHQAARKSAPGGDPGDEKTSWKTGTLMIADAILARPIKQNRHPCASRRRYAWRFSAKLRMLALAFAGP
jgi:hypothetical protein